MQFRRPSKVSEVGINISPLVDVIFLLVIFFDVSTTFLETAGLKLELPSSTSTAEREVEDITVLLAADGTLALGEERLDRETLRTRLRQELEEADRKIVVLRADAATTHGEVVELMDLIREAGAEGMTVAAKAAAD
jgi:biopolymer transport protein ExbD/biopolymer transport protein TolR